MNTVNFECLFEYLCQKLKSTNNLDVISRSFAQLKSDRDRVHYLLQLDAVQQHLQLPEDCSSVTAAGRKSPEAAIKLRSEGNQYFKAKSYMVALRKYTDSLSYAPLLGNKGDAEDSSASLAFANRSAVLFQLRKHQLCLDDINHAFSSGYPPVLAYKLFDRKGQCLLALGRSSEAAVSFHAAIDSLAVCDLEDTRRKQWHVDLKKRIQSCEHKHGTDKGLGLSELTATCQDMPECQRNSRFESLSDACDVACDTLLGRYIVAKRDIQPGEIVLSEKPYASIMLADSRLDHCSHCYKFTLAPIPCPSCCHCLYCTAQCRNLAYKLYHRVECPLGQIMEQSGVDKFAFLALRTLVVTPLDVIYKFCGPFSPCEAGNVVHTDRQNGEVYRAESYEAICGLVTHAEDRTAHDLFRRAAIAIFSVRCLCFAGFFETENPPLDVLSGAGGLLLSHLQSFPCNAHEIAEFDLDPEAVAASTPHELGAGIYATLSLFNHSCDPAVTRNFYGDRCVVRTIRSVRAGDELSDNYGTVFAMQTRSERRAKLLPQYFFECNCTACVQDWPLFSALREARPTWRCSNCFSALTTGVPNCTQCGSDMNLAERIEKLRKSDTVYKGAFDKLLKCCITEALPAFLSHLRVMDELLCPPCADYGACQEAVKQCFSIMANCRYITGNQV